MSKLKNRRPSPAMVVAIIALFVALAGTAYAAQTINGGAIQKQTIGGGKLKQKTLTGYQINTNKLGTVPSGQERDRAATPTGRSSTTRPSPGNATLARASDAGITRDRGRRRRQRRSSRSTSAAAPTSPGATTPAPRFPAPGYAQTNTSPANPNAIEVHTRDEKGANEDADFHLIVVCP